MNNTVLLPVQDILSHGLFTTESAPMVLIVAVTSPVRPLPPLTPAQVMWGIRHSDEPTG
jgi:hypothetical protein